MIQQINPFHELYMTESIASDRFVKQFSSLFVKHALALFQPGHVILKGLPGSGKSMLLSLLKPEVRIAYANANKEFPVPVEFRKFISAGINLARSGSADFGQRPIEAESVPQEQILPIYFGDFLNYWIAADLLISLETLIDGLDDKSLSEIGLCTHKNNLDNFASNVAKNRCWFGYLNNINSFSSLKERLSERISIYRSYLNYNRSDIPRDICTSKTSVGAPISFMAEALRKNKIISPEVKVYIHIDQYEELVWLEGVSKKLGESYQEVIHRALGMRDPHVSYRIGTRRFSWSEGQKMYATTARLEEMRNYGVIDIDEKLRRQEDPRTWIFPAFAQDVFDRRLSISGLQAGDIKKNTLSIIFGKGFLPKEKATKYIKEEGKKVIEIEPEWPEKWVKFLYQLSETDPLSARLAEAWARQQGKGDIVNSVPDSPPYPWEEKKYWVKERNEQALMQIASRNRQQLIWCGKDDVLALSGGNILVFISICQHIWDAWLRDTREQAISKYQIPKIDSSIQTVGLIEASREWYEKISNAEGGGERQQFVRSLGTMFYKRLIDDKAMSYPGHNGFSISVDELDSCMVVKEFLDSAVNYGELYDMPHTSRSKGEKRRKWYLNPIFSPHFKIPYIHTKEPLYIKLDEVIDWPSKSNMSVAQALIRNLSSSKSSKDNVEKQISLFSDDKSKE